MTSTACEEHRERTGAPENDEMEAELRANEAAGEFWRYHTFLEQAVNKTYATLLKVRRSPAMEDAALSAQVEDALCMWEAFIEVHQSPQVKVSEPQETDDASHPPPTQLRLRFLRGPTRLKLRWSYLLATIPELDEALEATGEALLAQLGEEIGLEPPIPLPESMAPGVGDTLDTNNGLERYKPNNTIEAIVAENQNKEDLSEASRAPLKPQGNLQDLFQFLDELLKDPTDGLALAEVPPSQLEEAKRLFPEVPAGADGSVSERPPKPQAKEHCLQDLCQFFDELLKEAPTEAKLSAEPRLQYGCCEVTNGLTLTEMLLPKAPAGVDGAALVLSVPPLKPLADPGTEIVLQVTFEEPQVAFGDDSYLLEEAPTEAEISAVPHLDYRCYENADGLALVEVSPTQLKEAEGLLSEAPAGADGRALAVSEPPPEHQADPGTEIVLQVPFQESLAFGDSELLTETSAKVELTMSASQAAAAAADWAQLMKKYTRADLAIWEEEQKNPMNPYAMLVDRLARWRENQAATDSLLRTVNLCNSFGFPVVPSDPSLEHNTALIGFEFSDYRDRDGPDGAGSEAILDKKKKLNLIQRLKKKKLVLGLAAALTGVGLALVVGPRVWSRASSFIISNIF